MKKLILAVFVSALAAGSALAQRPPRPGGPGGPGGFRPSPEMMKRLQARQEAVLEKTIKDLKLSPVQAKKFRAIQKDAQAQAMKVFQAPGDFAAKRPLMMKLRDKTEARIKGVLTPAQFKKFKAMQEEQRQQMRQRFGGGRGR